jgi:hypothetical protein
LGPDGIYDCFHIKTTMHATGENENEHPQNYVDMPQIL